LQNTWLVALLWHSTLGCLIVLQNTGLVALFEVFGWSLSA